MDNSPAIDNATPHGEHCAILVGKSNGSGAISPVLARACSNVSRQDAKQKLYAKQSGESPSSVRPYSGALLMTWWENTDYTGYSTDIYAGGSI
ncbi:MAG: hypothetical protein ACRDRN_17120 [Sciscionella sp.]